MKRIRAFINENPLTMWMAVFVALFYALSALVLHQLPSGREFRAHSHAVRAESLHSMHVREEAFTRNMGGHQTLIALTGTFFLLLLLAGIAVNLYAVLQKRRGRGVLEPAEDTGRPPLRLREVFQLFVFIYFIEAAMISLETALGMLIDLRGVDPDVFLVLNSLVRDIGTAVLALLLVTRHYRLPLSAIGLSGRRFGRRLAEGVGCYAAAVPWVMLMLGALNLVMQFFSYEPEPQAVVEIYMKKSADPYLLPLTLFVAVVGPVIEEIFFRGFTYRAFRARMGFFGAAAASSFLFAALHMNAVVFVPIFILGLFLCYLAEKTGSLVPSMTVHALHNTSMVGLTLAFKTISGSP